MKKPSVILAGYGSWAGAAINPAALIAESLGRRGIAEADLITLEMPVESAPLEGRIENLLLKHRPDIWIGIGVAVGRPTINLETIGLNLKHFRVPDNLGVMGSAGSVIDGGPLAYSSDLPNQDIVDDLLGNRIPATLSFHAGTHLCNQMLYTVRHLVEKHGLHTRSGFVHVPQSTDNVAALVGTEPAQPSMNLPLMKKAVELAVKCSVANLQSRGRTAA